MSITVNDLMKLPCLCRADVLAGYNGLSRVVTSVSILEYSIPTETQKNFFETAEFSGSELVLTGFCNVADDVEAQCMNIRRMAAVGEVGVILYYVGLVMPDVDQRLIDLCNELDFVLICMPRNDISLRYSEVIQEVMDAVFKDRLDSQTFAVDILEEMSRLPKNQQTVNTLLRVVSDRIQSTVVITDSEFQPLSAAPWPKSNDSTWESFIEKARVSPERDLIFTEEDERTVYSSRAEIRTDSDGPLNLLVFSENEKTDPGLWKQILDGVRIGMGLWGKGHGHANHTELVRAILMDEPIKMRRLGSLYHIDVEALSDTWIVKSMDDTKISVYADSVHSLCSGHAKIELFAEYENHLILFPKETIPLKEQEELSEEIALFFEKNKANAKFTRCPAMLSTSDVKRAYELNSEYVNDAITVFPSRKTFTISEIEFVKECRDIADTGKKNTEKYMSALTRIKTRKDGEEILATLECYLLDKGCSITDTAQALYVHKNTVKYRLQKAGDLLGFRIGDVPQSKNLMYALALRRLFSNKIH